MNAFAGLRVQAIASATASTGPGNPSGCGSASATTAVRTGSPRIDARAEAVSTTPGAITLSGTPLPAHDGPEACRRTHRFSAIFVER